MNKGPSTLPSQLAAQANVNQTAPPQPYLVTIPPKLNMTRAEAHRKLIQHFAAHPSTFPDTVVEVAGMEINHERSGAHAFVVNVSEEQALVLARDFFVSPLQDVTADTIDEVPEPEVETRTITSKTTWARDAMFASGTLAPSAVRTPVLYVVDTGVQPFVGTSSTWHLRWTPYANITLRQGRTSSLIGTWPSTSSADAPWDSAVDTVFTTKPSAPYLGTTFLDPQRDPIGHGTKIASVATGAFISCLHGLSGLSIEVESIRVYNTSSTVNTAVIIDGIYKAVDAHLQRVADAGGNPVPSVLVLASRTSLSAPANSRFDMNLEAALWWAWSQGIVCVVSGGDEGTATYATGHCSPEAMTLPLPSAQPTSPSRFVPQSTPPASWPSLTTPNGDPIPYPDTDYLLIVGGSNTSKTSPTAWGWATGSSRGLGIDILAPCNSLPCMKTSLATFEETNDSLVTATGTSLSAGYIAGIAAGYLASQATLPTPADVRSWLLSNVNGTNSPTVSSSASPFGNPSILVPRPKLTAASF